MSGKTYRVSFEDEKSNIPRKLDKHIQGKRLDTRDCARKEFYHRCAEQFLRESERVI